MSDLDKEEMWDVARKINPKITREQFEADWAEFVRLKAAKAKH